MRTALLGCLALACHSEATFPADAAEAGCARLDACDHATLSDVFGDVDECVRRERHLMEDAAASADALGCDYDADEARDCLDALETEACVGFELQAALTACASAFGCVE